MILYYTYDMIYISYDNIYMYMNDICYVYININCIQSRYNYE